MKQETTSQESESEQEDELLAKWLNLGSAILYLRKGQSENDQQQNTGECHNTCQRRGVKESATLSENTKETSKTQQKSSNPTTPSHRWERSVTLFNGLLVIIGTLQVWTYVASERAFVTVESPSAPLTINTPLVAHFQIRNSGRTAAFITEAVINLRIAKSLEEVPQYKRGGSVSIKGPLVAGASLPTTLKVRAENGAVITLDERMASIIDAGDLNLYAYGFISYQTQFRFFRTLFPEAFSHSTGFCYIYIPANKNWEYCKEDAYKYGD